MSNIQLPALSLLWEWMAACSSQCGLNVGLRVEQGTLVSVWLARVRVEEKLPEEEEEEVECQAWHLMVCWELCIGCDVVVIWCFCLFRVLFWISTWRPSLWARQSLRSTCWWARALELLVMLSHRQPCPVLSALSHLQDSCSPLLRYMSHAEFKDSVLPTLQKSLLRSPENVIESESVISALLSKSLSSWHFGAVGAVSLWAMLLVPWAQAGLSGIQGLDVEKQHLWYDPKCQGMW